MPEEREMKTNIILAQNTSKYSRIRLYHPRIYNLAAYIGHFRPEPNFYIIKSSGYIIQPSGYIGHFERCEREHLRT